MKKIRIKDLKCFKQVADVIGDEIAQVELCRVLYSDFEVVDPCIGFDFLWGHTPQGWDFWNKIHNKINPYTGFRTK